MLVHGFGESAQIWDTLIPSLSKKNSVICIDVPGFGLSEPLQMYDSMSTLAERMMDSLKPYAPFVYCGHSMGAYLGLAMLGQYPEAFKGLQLLHSTALADGDERKAGRNKTITFLQEHGKEAFLESFVPNLFYKKKSDYLSETLKICMETDVQSLIAMTGIMRDRQDSSQILQKSHCPISWIAGKQDALIPYQSLMDQIILPSDSHFHLLDDCGHMGMYEQREKTTALVQSFAHYCQSVSSDTL